MKGKRVKTSTAIYTAVLVMLMIILGVSAYAEETNYSSEVRLVVPGDPYTVTVSCDGGGSYGSYTRSDMNGELTATTNKEYNLPHGGITITAKPKDGFKSVITAVYTGGNTETSNTGTYTVKHTGKNVNVSVTFVRLQQYYIITSVTGGQGSLSPGGTVTVWEGGSQTITFNPTSGYKVGTVTVDGTAVEPKSSYTFSNVTANHKIDVTFAVDTSSTGTSTDSTGTAGTTDSTTTNATNSPKTGDNSDIEMYLLVLAVSLVGLMFTYGLFPAKKRS